MYLAGTQYNFEERLHSLAKTLADLTSFAEEGNTYFDNIDDSTLLKWNREFRHKYYEFTGTETTDNYIQESVWTPANIANLAAFWHLVPDKDCCFLSNGGAEAVATEAVGYAAPLYGTAISASEATNKPILRANGLEFAAAGSDILTTSANLTLAGDFTLYLVYESAEASAYFPVISGSAEGEIAATGTGFNVFFDSGFLVGVSIATGMPAASPALVRITRTGTTVAMSGGGPGGGENTVTPIDTALSLVLSRVGLSSNAAGPIGNDNSANRVTLISASTSYIAPNSAADIANRAGIAALTGASNWS